MKARQWIIGICAAVMCLASCRLLVEARPSKLGDEQSIPCDAPSGWDVQGSISIGFDLFAGRFFVRLDLKPTPCWQEEDMTCVDSLLPLLIQHLWQAAANGAPECNVTREHQSIEL